MCKVGGKSAHARMRRLFHLKRRIPRPGHSARIRQVTESITLAIPLGFDADDRRSSEAYRVIREAGGSGLQSYRKRYSTKRHRGVVAKVPGSLSLLGRTFISAAERLMRLDGREDCTADVWRRRGE